MDGSERGEEEAELAKSDKKETDGHRETTYFGGSMRFWIFVASGPVCNAKATSRREFQETFMNTTGSMNHKYPPVT